MMTKSTTRWNRTRGLLFVAALVLAVATSVAVTFAVGRPDGGAKLRGVSVLDDSTSSPGFSVVAVSATAFGTTIRFMIDLDTPLKDGESPALDLADFDIPGFSPNAIDYGISHDRQKAVFTLTGNALTAETRSLDITLRAFYVIPADGDGVRHEGPWHARASVSPGKVGTPQATGGESAIDTGYGWRYVIDAVEFDSTTARLLYHTEGDMKGLRPLPPRTSANPELVAMFPREGSGDLQVDRPSPGATLIFQFAGPLRPVLRPASATFEQAGGAWLPSAITIAGGSLPARVMETTNGGSPYLTVQIELNPAATIMLNGSGSPGQSARLSDDMGNSYPLEHGSGDFPPTIATWDFAGPLAPGASRVTFAIDGYGVVEDGDWSYSAPVP